MTWCHPGLNANPVPLSESYQEDCGTPGGTAGQATRITKATKGQFVSVIEPASIADTIVELVEKAVSQINNVRLIAAGATAPFVTAITPPGGHGPLTAETAHTLDFKVTLTGVIPCRESEQTFNNWSIRARSTEASPAGSAGMESAVLAEVCQRNEVGLGMIHGQAESELRVLGAARQDRFPSAP